METKRIVYTVSSEMRADDIILNLRASIDRFFVELARAGVRALDPRLRFHPRLLSKIIKEISQHQTFTPHSSVDGSLVMFTSGDKQPVPLLPHGNLQEHEIEFLADTIDDKGVKVEAPKRKAGAAAAFKREVGHEDKDRS